MSAIATLLTKLGQRARHAFGLPAQDATEEVWRLRHLRAAPARVPGTVDWRGQPLHYADGAALNGQLRDIFVARTYDFTTAHPAPRILDCGAHVGLGVIRWRELYPHADISAFEADPAIAEYLRRNLAARDDEQTAVLPAAWIEDGVIGFNSTGTDSGHISNAAQQTVPARDLAAFCRQPVDLLKMDIEGAEETVLAHLSATGSLRQVRRFICEWHQWTPDNPKLYEALASLTAAGFIYRISSADCLGTESSPAFPGLRWPGNHLVIHAWKPAAPGATS